MAVSGGESFACSKKKKHELRLDIGKTNQGEYPVTTSARLPPSRAVNLEFSQLSYSVKIGLRRETKEILKCVNGKFMSGELTAIMGPSGAGKSTLMNILAGYTRRSGVSGEVTINGIPRDMKIFRRESCYIMQDDQLQPLLTVQEAMIVAVNLKLGSELSHIQKRLRVNEILEALGLEQCRKTLTGALSGGQRKRLAIALELVNNPPIMFFDEPTSGLDSSTSKQCVSLLTSLAHGGRTIVCTIHQPSARLFEMFDHLYTLSEGKCIYQGCIKNLVPFLSSMGLECPAYHNPADFVLEISAGEYGDHLNALVEAMDNGNCSDWRLPAETNPDMYQKYLSSGMLTPVRAPTIPIFPEKKNRKKKDRKSYPTSTWTQFFVLLERTFLRLSRDNVLLYTRFAIHVVIGFLIGILYFQIGNDAAHARDNFGLLFYCVMFLMFTALLSVILTFPTELPILRREHFNRWYSLKSYYLATTMADVPLQIVCSVSYAVVVYFMTSQPNEGRRFMLFVVMCVSVSFVAQSIGLFIGASMTIQSGVFFGPLSILPFTIFSGFFIRMTESPYFFRWLYHISYLKYALEGVMLAVYGFDREDMDCSESLCHFLSPGHFLEHLDMHDSEYWHDVMAMGVFMLIFRIATYLMLKWRLHSKR